MTSSEEKMKIRLAVEDLTSALDTVSTVKPSNNAGESAYLFSVVGDKCYVHSQDAQGYARAEVPIESVDNPGSFLYPADRVESLKYLKGWIDMEAGQDGDRFWVKYKAAGGATANRSTYDSRTHNSFEKALSDSGVEHIFPTALLKESLSITSGYLSSEADPDQPYQTLQIFDASNESWAKGDGTMYAADSYRSCYFHSEALKGKGLSVHQKHIARIQTFLGKCEKTVKVKVGETMTFIVDQIPTSEGFRDGAVFGWSQHTKNHPSYKYYPAKHDKFILRIPKDFAVKALRQIRAELKDTKRDKIRVLYSAQDKSIKFLGSIGKEIAESDPVGVDAQPLDDGSNSGSEFAANVNVTNFLGLFEACRSHVVDLRVAFLDPDKGQKALFRTIENYTLSDAGKVVISSADTKETTYECRVTHFTPSIVD